MGRKRLADMTVVDTSALIAILFDEPERELFCGILERTGTALISTASVIEARMVARGRVGDTMVAFLDDLIDRFGIQFVPVTDEHVAIAHAAFVQYGKGNGHKAGLNFGDLFAYALAKSRDLPQIGRASCRERVCQYV